MKASDELISNLKKQILKNGETSFQIRIFDNKTGNVAYKYLTSHELFEITKLLEKDLEFI